MWMIMFIQRDKNRNESNVSMLMKSMFGHLLLPENEMTLGFLFVFFVANLIILGEL